MDNVAVGGAEFANYLPALLDGFPREGRVEFEDCRVNVRSR
jgi:hypothetical protein